MVVMNFLWVALGAACGGMLRYGLSLLLTPLCSFLNLGTFAANVLAAYTMGMMLAWSMHYPLSMPVKLLIMTGFLGGLSTFSSWNAEVWAAWQVSRYDTLYWTFFGHIFSTFIGLAIGVASFSCFDKVRQCW